MQFSFVFFFKNESLDDCQNNILFMFYPRMSKCHHNLQLLDDSTIWATAGFAKNKHVE
jgi:hypothetical protein